MYAFVNFLYDANRTHCGNLKSSFYLFPCLPFKLYDKLYWKRNLNSNVKNLWNYLLTKIPGAAVCNSKLCFFCNGNYHFFHWYDSCVDKTMLRVYADIPVHQTFAGGTIPLALLMNGHSDHWWKKKGSEYVELTYRQIFQNIKLK